MDTVTIVTDGSCLGNPGPGGWAALLQCGPHEKMLSGGVAESTNNRMELTAVLHGLQALKRPCAVTLVTDSQLVAKGLTEWLPQWQARNWQTTKRQPVKNREAWEAIAEVMAAHTIRVEHVPGHAGHPLNERVDQVARQAAEQTRTLAAV